MYCLLCYRVHLIIVMFITWSFLFLVTEMYVVDTNLAPVWKWCMLLIYLFFNRLRIFPFCVFLMYFSFCLFYNFTVCSSCYLCTVCFFMSLCVHCWTCFFVRVCVNLLLVWAVIFEFFGYGPCCCECLVLNVILKCVMLSYIHILSLSDPMFQISSTI
jgi:hypothetical protein